VMRTGSERLMNVIAADTIGLGVVDALIIGRVATGVACGLEVQPASPINKPGIITSARFLHVRIFDTATNPWPRRP
jgi:hypothetical protein